jgi:hypothetical protein
MVVRPRSCSSAASRVGGLRDQRGFVEAGGTVEGGDDTGVEAASTDGGVTEVDDRVPARIEAGKGGADGDGLASAYFAGDHAEAAFADAPADPGDRFGMRAVTMQHLRRQARPNGVRLKP